MDSRDFDMSFISLEGRKAIVLKIDITEPGAPQSVIEGCVEALVRSISW
jgi:hypothetical protein